MNVRKPIVSIFVIGGTLILAVAVVLSLRRGHPSPTINGQFTPEEVRQIELAVRHDRWSIIRSLLSTHRFRMAFEVCMADVAFGSIDEIGPNNGLKITRGGSITNSMDAYLISRGCYQKKIVKYELERTTTGWKIAMVVFPTMKASNPQGGASRRQPSSSELTRTSAAAASGRSP